MTIRIAKRILKIKNMKNIIYLFFCLAIISCGVSEGDKKRIEIEDRQVFAEKNANELFEKIATPSERFTLDIKSDTALVCKNGTIISIPKDGFMDKDGNVVSQNVTIEVVEALSLNDFLRNDLQTVSGNRLLQSAGMIYIDASVGDQALTLKENTSLQVEFPAPFVDSDFKVFTGKHDDQGNINWQEEEDIDERMIPFPLKELDLKYYTAYRFVDGRLPIEYMDSSIINDPKYEGTYIATLEFQRRFNMLGVNYIEWWEGHEKYMNSLKKGDWRKYLTKHGVIHKIICPPIEMYLNNIDKPLWYTDSLVFDFLEERRIRDSTRFANSELYKEKGHHYMWYYLDTYYQDFFKQKLTHPKSYDPKGVNMDLPNAKESLIAKGYSPKEAYEQLLIYRTRERIIKQRREEKRIAKEKQDYQAKISKTYSAAFNIDQLGWINVDRFFDDPNAKEVELFVQTLNDSLDFCNLTLLLPDRSVAINGIQMINGNYRFTQEEGMYSKLPLGEKAIVVAMSSKNGRPYFGMQALEIKEKQDIELVVEESTWIEIEERLAGVN